MNVDKIIDIIRSLKEEAIAAPTNSVGGGNIAGLGVGPQGEPPGIPASKKKKKERKYLKGPGRKLWLDHLRKK